MSYLIDTADRSTHLKIIIVASLWVQVFAIFKEMVELRAVAGHVRCVEHRPEDALHILNMLANRYPHAGLELDIRRAFEMIGVGVRLQHLLDLDTELVRFGQYGVS
jgi:hypothetical protein